MLCFNEYDWYVHDDKTHNYISTGVSYLSGFALKIIDACVNYCLELNYNEAMCGYKA